MPKISQTCRDSVRIFRYLVVQTYVYWVTQATDMNKPRSNRIKWLLTRGEQTVERFALSAGWTVHWPYASHVFFIYQWTTRFRNWIHVSFPHPTCEVTLGKIPWPNQSGDSLKWLSDNDVHTDWFCADDNNSRGKISLIVGYINSEGTKC